MPKKEYLSQLKIKDKAIIESINCSSLRLRSHILDMGLTPGAEVTLVKKAPMGDPLEIQTRGYELTLRKEDAAQIKIRPCNTACAECPLKDACNNAHLKLNPIEHPKFGERLSYDNTDKLIVKRDHLHLALVGNQNSGKTTLFNQLTGAHQHVGNFPGVTIDRIDGVIRHHPEAVITDLPGIYSLSPYSPEEKLTRDFILSSKPDAIINIVDAGNIERNLFLSMQLIDLNIPMVIALNMFDEVRESGGSIDVNELEAALGVPVVPISAAKNEGLEELIDHVLNVAKYQEKPRIIDFCDNNGKNSAVHTAIHSIVHLIEKQAKAAELPKRFAATKLIEGDPLVLKQLDLTKDQITTCQRIVSAMEKERGLDKEAALADMRFSFIESICRAFVHRSQESPARRRSRLADKIITGKYTALPLFLLVMTFIFYMTFGPIGSFFSDLIADGIDRLSSVTDTALTEYGLNPVVKSLIIDGIFAGVGGVLSFLPVIVILFFFLSILEDTGYMARVAFVMDKLLRTIGLSGRSFVPMLIGFGCSVPAIMATRTLPSERDRKMTILLVPFMSCSAKLPIYALFTAAFFADHKVPIIIVLYVIGIVVGIIFALIVKNIIFRGEPVPFVMELPNYRFPTARNIAQLVFAKAKGFITKAFTIIFFATILIWFFQTFDSRLNVVTSSENSILASLGTAILPLFEPLGIYDWRISTAFLTGFMAKESVISTLTVLLGGEVEKLPQLFTQFTAFVFLIFCLLYTPCVAAIATVKRELGRSYALAVVFVQCAIAWIVSFIVYHIGMLIM